ncbi:hypothetical protein [Jannaschia donghaensis]|uniref:hypothetical protein n=1 Tax=Jannaschia donghaensis TaxID=420998 RepID=UPI001187512C|nr:hypothetical protein [Jannaschia donghaensis]
MPETLPVDDDLIKLLVSRSGILTVANLKVGLVSVFIDIVWGYDIGDQYAHITTNVSPGREGLEIDFFFTSEIISLLDYEDQSALFDFPI